MVGILIQLEFELSFPVIKILHNYSVRHNVVHSCWLSCSMIRAFG